MRRCLTARLQAHLTGTFINSVAFSFDTRTTENKASSDTIALSAELRDQYNFPVFNETVNFSAVVSNLGGDGIQGTFSDNSVLTNTSGIAETVYTPSITPTDIIVNVTAEVA